MLEPFLATIHVYHCRMHHTYANAYHSSMQFSYFTGRSVFAVVAVIAVDALAAVGTHHARAVVNENSAVITFPA